MLRRADVDAADAKKIQIAKGVISPDLSFQALVAVAVAFDFDTEKAVGQDGEHIRAHFSDIFFL